MNGGPRQRYLLSQQLPIDEKRYPLFMARAVMQQLIKSLQSNLGVAILIALHKNARTTPTVRAEIAANSEIAGVLAQRYCITEQTVCKWKKRSFFGDRSHTSHRLQTVLTPA